MNGTVGKKVRHVGQQNVKVFARAARAMTPVHRELASLLVPPECSPMPVSERELREALEHTLVFYPPIPGLTEDLGVAGVRGRVTPVSHPLANAVAMTRLDERSADAAVGRVVARFREARKAFCWITGPLTTPADLPRRLEAAGLRHAERLAGMALEDLATPIPADPAVRVREVTIDEALAAREMMARAYDLPVDATELFVRILANAAPIRTRCYFAFDGPDPVAWSYLVYVPDSPMVLLGGAATLPEARGRGIYTALVKRRLDDARADGRGVAIIQAVRETSAPICAKLGFREVCSFELYVWSPGA